MSRLLDLIAFDVTDQIELIDRPLPMVARTKADTRYLTEEAFERANGTQDKTLFLTEDATHIETCWVDEYVDAALGELVRFFARTL